MTVNGTSGNDDITVTAAGQQVRVAGLASVVEVNRADKSLDTLFVDTRPRQRLDLHRAAGPESAQVQLGGEESELRAGSNLV